VLGDLFEIGEHRLLCGDSTDSDAVARLMDGQKADIMVSDPPYGIDLDTDYSKMGATTTKYEKIKGDDKEFDLTDVISISGTKEQYIWGGDYFVNSLDWMSGTQIIWAKRHSEEENKVFGSAFESLWVSYKCKKLIWFIRPINQSSERLGKHPTQKPIECMSRCIEMSKLKGGVYDAFLGSGSTMVASHQLKRKCYGMELDPKYCQVIVDRMKKLDPLLVIKRNGQLID
jgi:DNA modification methylase